jgi:hypothetical protein
MGLVGRSSKAVQAAFMASCPSVLSSSRMHRKGCVLCLCCVCARRRVGRCPFFFTPQSFTDRRPTSHQPAWTSRYQRARYDAGLLLSRGEGPQCPGLLCSAPGSWPPLHRRVPPRTGRVTRMPCSRHDTDDHQENMSTHLSSHPSALLNPFLVGSDDYAIGSKSATSHSTRHHLGRSSAPESAA